MNIIEYAKTNIDDLQQDYNIKGRKLYFFNNMNLKIIN